MDRQVISDSLVDGNDVDLRHLESITEDDTADTTYRGLDVAFDAMYFRSIHTETIDTLKISTMRRLSSLSI